MQFDHLCKMMKTSDHFLVRIKSYSKNTYPSFILKWIIPMSSSAVSRIPQFGDTNTSLKEMIHLHWETTTSSEGDAASPVGDAVSPTGGLLACPNLGICDTIRRLFFCQNER